MNETSPPMISENNVPAAQNTGHNHSASTEASPLKKKSGKSFSEKAAALINSLSVYRIAFFTVMYADIRYLAYHLYYGILLFMLAWAIYLFIRHYIIGKKIFRIRFRKIIYIFLASGTLTVIIHSERNLFENIIIMLWLSICLLMFYGIHAEKSNLRLRKEMKRLFDLIVYVTTAVMLIGLICFAIFPNGVTLFGYEFCIHEGRFVGIIANANVTAFYAAIDIVLCTFLLRMRKADHILSGKRRFWYIFSIIINTFCLLITDSNATLLFMIVFLSFLCVYELFKEYSRQKLHTFLFRLVALALSLVLVATSALILRTKVQSGVSTMLTMSDSQALSTSPIDAEQDNIKLDKSITKTAPEASKKSLGHKNTNIDSGRFVLWRQALGLIEQFPLLGIGKANTIDYGLEYLGKIRYSTLGGQYYIDFHNGLISIAVSFGLIGLVIFLVFAVSVAKVLLKSLFRFKERSRRDGNVLVLIIAFCAAYFVYSMFEVALLMDYTYRVFIFWLIVGFGMSYALKYRQQFEYTGQKLPPVNDDASEIKYVHRKFFHK